MRISIPGHVFLNFSGTAQNWMAIVLSASLSSATWFFLPRAWLMRRNRPQWGFVELHGFLTPNLMPNGWCITTMTYRCSWLRLMVAPAGEADRFSTKTSYLPSVLFAWLHWRRNRLSRWFNFITQLAMHQMFPRRRIDVGTKSISFVLISKPSHNFVFSSPVILFAQLLTLIKNGVD